ncbi:hypothetical protein C8Q75DRAFT_805320 [Abortiporus biennis]|nr:hypothetical protein C8Q75DRAFT_805320 [Abortiporus biennis]
MTHCKIIHIKLPSNASDTHKFSKIIFFVRAERTDGDYNKHDSLVFKAANISQDTVTLEIGTSLGVASASISDTQQVTLISTRLLRNGYYAKYERNHAWSETVILPEDQSQSVAAHNQTQIPQTFAFCTTHVPSGQHDNDFIPFSIVEKVRSNTRVHVKNVLQLEAYVVDADCRVEPKLGVPKDKVRMNSTKVLDYYGSPWSVRIDKLPAESDMEVYFAANGTIQIRNATPSRSSTNDSISGGPSGQGSSTQEQYVYHRVRYDSNPSSNNGRTIRQDGFNILNYQEGAECMPVRPDIIARMRSDDPQLHNNRPNEAPPLRNHVSEPYFPQPPLEYQSHSRNTQVPPLSTTGQNPRARPPPLHRNDFHEYTLPTIQDAQPPLPDVRECSRREHRQFPEYSCHDCVAFILHKCGDRGELLQHINPQWHAAPVRHSSQYTNVKPTFTRAQLSHRVRSAIAEGKSDPRYNRLLTNTVERWLAEDNLLTPPIDIPTPYLPSRQNAIYPPLCDDNIYGIEPSTIPPGAWGVEPDGNHGIIYDDPQEVSSRSRRGALPLDHSYANIPYRSPILPTSNQLFMFPDKGIQEEPRNIDTRESSLPDTPPYSAGTPPIGHALQDWNCFRLAMPTP